MEEALETDDPAFLLDAGVIVSYVGTAVSLGLTALTAGELKAFNERLREHVSKLIDQEVAPTRKARLLHALAFYGSIPDPEYLDQLSASQKAEGAERAYVSDYSEVEIEPDVVAAFQFTAKEEAIAAWSQLAELLESTPLFPVDELAQKLDFLAPAFMDDPRWEGIQAAIDASIRRLNGDNAVAERARDRALAELRAGRIRRALHHFHAAAQLWWNGDTLRGALLAMLGAADGYCALGLHQASKQYALAVAGAALADGREEVQDLIPHAVLVAAHADYMAGAWTNAVQLIDVGFELQEVFIDDEADVWREHDDQSAILSLIWAFRAARSASLEIADEVEGLCKRNGVLEMFEKLLAEFGEMSIDKLNEIVDTEGAGRPFTDLGKTREIRFAALGIRWRITSENTYVSSRAAERLAGAAQLLLVQIADDDLCLVPIEIEVHVQALEGGDTKYSLARDFKSKSRKWLARVTPVEPGEPMDADSLHFELHGLLATILADASALPQQAYFSALRRAFERGLGAQLVVGRPYDETAEVLSKDRFSEVDRSVESPYAQGAPPPVEHPELAWQDGPGPTYSDELARSSIELRYERIPRLIPHTLEAIVRSTSAQVVVKELREMEWLDWHILNALANISINRRLEAKGLNVAGVVGTPEGSRLASVVAQTPEQSPSEAIDPASISIETMEQARVVSVGAYLSVWDLEPRTGALDIAAYDRLISERYRYWDDDVDHDDPFETSSNTSD